jgi:hypothetical protein
VGASRHKLIPNLLRANTLFHGLWQVLLYHPQTAGLTAPQKYQTSLLRLTAINFIFEHVYNNNSLKPFSFQQSAFSIIILYEYNGRVVVVVVAVAATAVVVTFFKLLPLLVLALL